MELYVTSSKQESYVDIIFSLHRQISIISADGENTRSRSVRRHGCSQRKHSESQEKKKPQEVEKLIQAETTETGRVSPSSLYFLFSQTNILNCPFLFSHIQIYILPLFYS